jgi:tRNA(fMet)-specific endonuclease VapC
MFILDTNILSDYFKSHERIRARIIAAPIERPVVTTVITWFEITSGRFQSLLKAANRKELLTASERIASSKQELAEFILLPITDLVADYFEQLLTNKKLKKIGRPDLLIACIALANAATLVTRNTKDFHTIPSLKLENWAD